MGSSKTKTLLVYKYLNEFSDEDNALSTTELIDLLANDGIKCERKSIYADIKTLNDIGFDILSTKSPKRGFFMASRRFELAEVRLLIDAVSSVGFITPKKTNTLISKLESLVSKNQADDLTSQVYVSSDTKCDNEEIYYVIDALNDAISKKVKVKFVYKRRTIDKENRKAYTEKTFTVSPYALVWKNDHYYLVCNNEKYDNLMNLRLDRMRKLVILDEESRDFSEVSKYEDKFDIADYSSKMFNMYSGENDDVEFICDLDLREEIMDRFGSKIPLTAVDTDHFITTVNVAISDGLVSWIMSFGNKIKVIKPETLSLKVKERAEEIAATYQ